MIRSVSTDSLYDQFYDHIIIKLKCECDTDMTLINDDFDYEYFQNNFVRLAVLVPNVFYKITAQSETVSEYEGCEE